MSVLGGFKEWLFSLRDARRVGRVRKIVAANRASGTGVGDLVKARREWLFANLPEESAEFIYDLHSKPKQRRLAERVGASLPEQYLDAAPLAAALDVIEFSSFPRVVLKPNQGRNGLGVYCLVRVEGGYHDLITDRVYSMEQLRRAAVDSFGSLGRDDTWSLEELLLSPDDPRRAADDVKFYCFGGRAELIRVRNAVGDGKRRKHAMRHFDRDGNPVDPGLSHSPTSDGLSLPAAFPEMLAEAERVSGAIPTPFIRIDMYDTHRGPVLGELTPGPGTLYTLNEEWYRRFTRRWHESARELESALVSGAVTPLLPSETAVGVSSAARETVTTGW